jgi:hypothetical protein
MSEHTHRGSAPQDVNGASPGRRDYADPDQVVLEEVGRAIRSIEFGSILIKLHEGRVVGIETSTKLRLPGHRS